MRRPFQKRSKKESHQLWIVLTRRRLVLAFIDVSQPRTVLHFSWLQNHSFGKPRNYKVSMRELDKFTDKKVSSHPTERRSSVNWRVSISACSLTLQLHLSSTLCSYIRAEILLASRLPRGERNAFPDWSLPKRPEEFLTNRSTILSLASNNFRNNGQYFNQ